MKRTLKYTVTVVVEDNNGHVNLTAIANAINNGITREREENGLTSDDDAAFSLSVEVDYTAG